MAITDIASSWHISPVPKISRWTSRVVNLPFLETSVVFNETHWQAQNEKPKKSGIPATVDMPACPDISPV